jgi:hypothetical protein
MPDYKHFLGGSVDPSSRRSTVMDVRDYFTEIGSKPMKFACLVYIEDKNLDVLPEDQLSAIVAECGAAKAWEEELKKGGNYISSAGLQSVRTAATVRNRHGELSVTDGPFAETKEFLGGFTIIEAKDMSEAIHLVSKFQTRMLTVEIRPLMAPNAELTDPVDRKIVDALHLHPP